MKTSIAAAAVALTLAGCSSAPSAPKLQDDPIVTSLKGQTSGYVQKTLGLPNERSELPSGAMVWVYKDNQKGMTANQCKVTLSIRNDSVESVVISTDRQSLLSVLASSCDSIRKAVTQHS